jgi:hypothetical protein
MIEKCAKLLEMPVHDGGGEEPAIAMGSVGGLKKKALH